ncbi:phosphopantetheine-binding protein [uncultured Paracoccus sp.]|uniref:phosphopantetheine-binding protein n=1 Tax=uncultured Paracoccus sp. TaxID=189685 RepID=UPI0025E0A573|nr:phosphopantetheine-binding protein [uncultured Paracoccus sp.]
MTLTLDRMRADIAKAIHMDPADLRDDDHLADLGLDSLRLMRLVLAWEEAGLTADFSLFAEYDTLGDWWAHVVAPTIRA